MISIWHKRTRAAHPSRRRLAHTTSLESLETRTLLTGSGFASLPPTIGPTAVEVATAAASDRVQRIVNGVQTTDFESVGIVNGQCSGTLIASNAVLTAGHCIPGEPQSFQLGSQTYAAANVVVHPDYNTSDVDLAVMLLQEDVRGVAPSPINRIPPTVGQTLTLVGFGGTGTASGGHNGDFGIKHVGQTPIDEVTNTEINWNFDHANEANTAPGDSGGPAFLNIGGEYVVAGVTSGGTLDNAGLGDYSFDVRVDAFANWIDAVLEGGINGVDTEDPTDQEVPGDPGVNEPSLPQFPDEEVDDVWEFPEYDDGTITTWAQEELAIYDTNGDDMLSKQELVQEFMDLDYSRQESREEAQYLLAAFDLDGDQKLDLDELIASYQDEEDDIWEGGDEFETPIAEDDSEVPEELDWPVDDQYLAGDVDADGLVGFGDFLIVSQHFGMLDADLGHGDLDGDGIVGFGDFLSVSQNFGAQVESDMVFAAEDDWLLW